MRVRSAGLVLVAGALVGGCSSTVNGTPIAGDSSPLRSSVSAPRTGGASGTAVVPPGGPPSVSGSAGRSTAPRSTSRPIETLSVTGLSSRRTYTVNVWAKDHITDCAGHSYGAPIRAYFTAHPCRGATRRLATLRDDGRLVAMSVVVVDCDPGGPDNLYRWAGRFSDLEKSDGTGSISDLLREGRRIPGAGRRIPSSEAFHVVGEDLTVVVFDAWYIDGATRDGDPDLIDLEDDLFLTAVTAP